LAICLSELKTSRLNLTSSENLFPLFQFPFETSQGNNNLQLIIFLPRLNAEQTQTAAAINSNSIPFPRPVEVISDSKKGA
jgi:hypothetical protein